MPEKDEHVMMAARRCMPSQLHKRQTNETSLEKNEVETKNWPLGNVKTNTEPVQDWMGGIWIYQLCQLSVWIHCVYSPSLVSIIVVTGYNLKEIGSDVLFLLSDDFKISILSSTKRKTDRSRKEGCALAGCANQQRSFSLQSAELRLTFYIFHWITPHLAFTLNTSVEILTSSLASHHSKKDKWAKDEDFSPTALIDQRPLSWAEWKNQNGVNRLKCTDIFIYTS